MDCRVPVIRPVLRLVFIFSGTDAFMVPAYCILSCSCWSEPNFLRSRLGQGHNVVEPAGIQRATAITHRDWIAGALHVGGNGEPRTCGQLPASNQITAAQHGLEG